MKKVAISAVLLFGTSLPTIASEPSAEQRREIEGIIQKWADAFNQGDYKQQVSYATNDIEAVGPWGVWIGKEYNLQMTEKTYAFGCTDAPMNVLAVTNLLDCGRDKGCDKRFAVHDADFLRVDVHSQLLSSFQTGQRAAVVHHVVAAVIFCNG